MQRLKYALIWLAISLLLGVVASHFFDINFWLASLIAALALVANGLVAEWEDRREWESSE